MGILEINTSEKFILIVRITLLILFPILEGIKDGNSLSKNSFKYHACGWIMRASVSFTLIPYLQVSVFYAGYFWFVFEVIRNKTASNDPFYVGNTAWTDKHLGKNIFIIKSAFLIAGLGITILNLIK